MFSTCYTISIHLGTIFNYLILGFATRHSASELAYHWVAYFLFTRTENPRGHLSIRSSVVNIDVTVTGYSSSFYLVIALTFCQAKRGGLIVTSHASLGCLPPVPRTVETSYLRRRRVAVQYRGTLRQITRSRLIVFKSSFISAYANLLFQVFVWLVLRSTS